MNKKSMSSSEGLFHLGFETMHNVKQLQLFSWLLQSQYMDQLEILLELPNPDFPKIS